MEINFCDKVVVISGALGGLGRSMAKSFAENGAKVVVCDLSGSAEFAKELSDSGAQVTGLDFDLTDREAVRAAACEIEKLFGRVDVLVNNAGINVGPEQRKTIENFDDAWWDKIQDVDLGGVYNLSKAIIPLMSDNGGAIINISSIVGMNPLRNQCSFAAAKAGVINLSRAMALELAPKGIRVNVVAPGTVRIEITNALWTDNKAMQGLLSHIPLNRQAVPDDISGAVMFLASDFASYITGAVLPVDGGWTAGGFMRDF